MISTRRIVRNRLFGVPGRLSINVPLRLINYLASPRPRVPGQAGAGLGSEMTRTSVPRHDLEEPDAYRFDTEGEYTSVSPYKHRESPTYDLYVERKVTVRAQNREAQEPAWTASNSSSARGSTAASTLRTSPFAYPLKRDSHNPASVMGGDAYLYSGIGGAGAMQRVDADTERLASCGPYARSSCTGRWHGSTQVPSDSAPILRSTANSRNGDKSSAGTALVVGYGLYLLALVGLIVYPIKHQDDGSGGSGSGAGGGGGDDGGSGLLQRMEGQARAALISDSNMSGRYIAEVVGDMVVLGEIEAAEEFAQAVEERKKELKHQENRNGGRTAKSEAKMERDWAFYVSDLCRECAIECAAAHCDEVPVPAAADGISSNSTSISGTAAAPPRQGRGWGLGGRYGTRCAFNSGNTKPVEGKEQAVVRTSNSAVASQSSKDSTAAGRSWAHWLLQSGGPAAALPTTAQIPAAVADDEADDDIASAFKDLDSWARWMIFSDTGVLPDFGSVEEPYVSEVVE